MLIKRRNSGNLLSVFAFILKCINNRVLCFFPKCFLNIQRSCWLALAGWHFLKGAEAISVIFKLVI